MTASRLFIPLVMISLLLGPVANGITINQLDDFQDGSTMGWAEGSSSPNPPVNIPDGGPLGVGDRYVQNESNGVFGPGGKLVMFNLAQWTGDYNDAGVTRIKADLANFGTEDLFIRIAIEGGPFQRFGSIDAVVVPADGLWHAAQFDLNETGMAQVLGSDPLSTVLQTVTALRILSAASGPSWEGDQIVATLGVDNILALPEPAGPIFLALGGLALLARRRID